jgi:UDP-N-acetylmuramate dehydrogenase
MAAAYSLAGNVSLRSRNTFGVEAQAACLATVHDREALPELLDLPQARAGAMVLGEGSNVLFVGDYPGTLLHLAFDDVSIAGDDGDSALVRAAAGLPWESLVEWTLQQGLCGLENLTYIPGLVGAAPIQNIGAYGVEIGEFIAAVEAYDRQAGRIVRLDRAACGFGYRDSTFKSDLARWIVCAIELRLARNREPVLGYAGIVEELATMGVVTPTAPTVARAVRRQRIRKLPDPTVIGNAGSFFKNPVVPASVADTLRAAYPGLPVYPAGSERKLSAAWLIEHCGLKGWRDGDAGMSAQHALVLVNHGHATGAQLLAAARHVARKVQDRYGVALEPEPRIVGAAF